MRFSICAFLIACVSSAQQTPSAPGTSSQGSSNQRDLVVEPSPAPAASKPSTSPPLSAAPEGAKALPRGYALVIGVGRYQNLPEKNQLPFAERDAEAMYGILISPEGGNFHAENVHKLIGPKATLENMKRELEDWLPKAAKPQDRVLIYFAGHGFAGLPNGQAYLAPYDFRPSDPTASGYPMAALANTIQNSIVAKWKVLFTDACHSGAIAPDAAVQQINRQLSTLDQSLFSLTASRDREASYEGKAWGGGHGIFTYYVVQGMEGAADENGDGYVTADELANYVRVNVRDATGGKQNPTSERGSFDPAMNLAYVPSHIKPETPPAKYGALIFESNMDQVEVFLDGNSLGSVTKGSPLRQPGLTPGTHVIKAVRMGYEPDGPREEVVYPGQDTTVTIRILIPRHRSKAATDELDRGIKYYTAGSEKNYQLAVQCFNAALAIDPKFSEADMFLGRAYRDLYQPEKAVAAFRTALDIDPDYTEARDALAGVLLDQSSLDEAVRQANTVIQRNPKDGEAYYLLSQALCRKGSYGPAVDAARSAIILLPNKGEAHFWLAESLHLSKSLDEAVAQYDQYLRLSNFDSKLAGQLNYYILGYLIGMGKRSHAAQQDVWKDLRGLAYFGECDCKRLLGRLDDAITDCQKSLSYSQDDPRTHYVLGVIYAMQANKAKNLDNGIGLANVARQHFENVVHINPDLDEAVKARKMIASIDAQIATFR
jgi:tetratricopeptide (TPR) repeat protein